MKKAFTLIELLVVVGIIAILSAIVFARFEVARSRARDAERISDLAQMQLGVQLYFDRCGRYPTASGNTINTASSCTASGVTVHYRDFVELPVAPRPGGDTSTDYDYVYAVTNSGGDYYLGARLENYNSVLNDDRDIIIRPTGSWTGVQNWGATTDSPDGYYYVIGAR